MVGGGRDGDASLVRLYVRAVLVHALRRGGDAGRAAALGGGLAYYLLRRRSTAKAVKTCKAVGFHKAKTNTF